MRGIMLGLFFDASTIGTLIIKKSKAFPFFFMLVKYFMGVLSLKEMWIENIKFIQHYVI